MKCRRGLAVLLLAAVAGTALVPVSALAHSFNLALVIPLSNGASAEGDQIREGFMLATTERDSHPDETSDGHLGGLDVHVSVIDGKGDVAAGLGPKLARGEVDIVAAFGSEATLSLVGDLLEGKNVVLLLPGQSPFSDPNQPGVAAFVAAFESHYGRAPTAQTARGYNAARRIDAAVRAQGGVDDTAALRRSFADTARGFTW